jgi:hypothetical protein
MSTHEVRVIRIAEIEKHPNADRLGIVEYCPLKTEELSRLERSTLAEHLAEGIVVKPAQERWDGRVGRIALKLVSDSYLERAK